MRFLLRCLAILVALLVGGFFIYLSISPRATHAEHDFCLLVGTATIATAIIWSAVRPGRLKQIPRQELRVRPPDLHVPRE